MGTEMTPEQFAYWLQGFVELHGERPTQEQWNQIKEHVSLVFNKVTHPPQYINPNDTAWGSRVIC